MSETFLELNETFDGVPVLSFHSDAHLSWRGGYKFAVSKTMDALTECQSSSSCMDRDLRIYQSYNFTQSERQRLNKLIVLSHVYQASIDYPELWKSLHQDSSALNQLLKSTTQSCDLMLLCKDFNLEEVLNSVEVSDTISVTKDCVVINVKNENPVNSLGATVVLEQNSLSLYNSQANKWYSIDLGNAIGRQVSSVDSKHLLSRLVYVLQCKAKLQINDNVGNLDGEILTSDQPLSGIEVKASDLCAELENLYPSSKIVKSSIFEK